ncbi:MAG: hypothetical protein SNJ78_03040 [Spirochaetales bacterium]
MEIPPSLTNHVSSSFPLQDKRGIPQGEGREAPTQTLFLPTSLGTPNFFRHFSRTLNRQVLREWIHRMFLTCRTALPGGQGYSIIEQFIAQALPHQYVSRLGFARQWVEKGLPLTKEGLQKLFLMIEGDSSADPIEMPEAEDRVVLENTKASVDGKEEKKREDVTILEEFNKKQTSRGQWILIPFRYSLEKLSFVACLRIHLSSSNRSCAAFSDKIVLSVRRNHPKAKTWYFAWNPHSSQASLSLYPPLDEAPLPTDLLESLRKKLRKIGLKLDDNKDKGSIFDGFDELESIFQNIDEQV